MRLIVGLGNYPKEYDLTRHNIGFMCVDNFAQKYNGIFKTENKFKAEIANIDFQGEKILIAKPLTYMNSSGEAIQKILAFYKIDISDIFVVYDDIALNLGKFRFRPNGSDGGHNGIKSIISMLSSDKFPRLKVGIGPQPTHIKSETYVLQKFTQDQMSLLNKIVSKSIDAIEDYLNQGINNVQNKYNGLEIE